MATLNRQQGQTVIEFAKHINQYNPEMIRLARESRGMTQSELCQKMGIQQGTISKIENRMQACSDDIIELAAKTLQYPLRFFAKRSDSYAMGEAYYRRYLSVTGKTLQRIEAKINILRMGVEELLKSVNYPSENLITWNVEKDGGPEQAAKALRECWHIPKGPIKQLLELLEDNGIIAVPFNFGEDAIDGLSVRGANNVPVIFYNRNMKGDRIRLTIAHELGHLVMHIRQAIAGSRDVESEAFRFGSEFLVPNAEFERSFTKLDLPTLAGLKRYWMVSMSSMIKKASIEDLITPNQTRYLYAQMAKNGYMKREPTTLDVAIESSSLLREIIEVHVNEMNYTKSELAELVLQVESEFDDLFLGEINKRGPFTIIRSSAD